MQDPYSTRCHVNTPLEERTVRHGTSRHITERHGTSRQLGMVVTYVTRHHITGVEIVVPSRQIISTLINVYKNHSNPEINCCLAYEMYGVSLSMLIATLQGRIQRFHTIKQRSSDTDDCTLYNYYVVRGGLGSSWCSCIAQQTI